MPDTPDPAMRAAYVDLLKRTVNNYAYLGGAATFAEFNCLTHYDRAAEAWGIEAVSRPMSLLSKGQLDLIESVLLDVEARGVPGDLIEAGVWNGGAVMLMRGLMRAYGIDGRDVIAADTFSGIPPNPRFRHDPVDAWTDRWAAGLDQVRGHFARLDLLDERVVFLEGDFAETLASLSNRRFALIRLDSDAHDSVMSSLEHLYPLLSPGGVVIIDDWHLYACRFAVDAYRKAHGISEPVSEIAGNGLWTKRAA